MLKKKSIKIWVYEDSMNLHKNIESEEYKNLGL